MGSFNPIRSISSFLSETVASCPKRLSTGSPINRKIVKDTRAIISSTAIECSNLRKMMKIICEKYGKVAAV